MRLVATKTGLEPARPKPSAYVICSVRSIFEADPLTTLALCPINDKRFAYASPMALEAVAVEMQRYRELEEQPSIFQVSVSVLSELSRAHSFARLTRLISLV